MDDRILTHLLTQLRATPLPAVPATFRQDVWRTIRQRSSQSSPSWFAAFFEPLFRPSLAFASLAVAMVVGAGVGSMALDSRSSHTRQALGLEVFSSSSPSLPTTLISHAR